jgi:hypothetical protein
MREPLSAAGAGQTNAAAEKRNAIVPAENRGGEPVRIPDMSPTCWIGHYKARGSGLGAEKFKHPSARPREKPFTFDNSAFGAWMPPPAKPGVGPLVGEYLISRPRLYCSKVV